MAERDFDAIADDLYALHPDKFASARDDAVKQARADKDQQLAKELGKLRKPTLSAWLINRLWRDQREVMEQLFELAAELGQAQARAAGGELRELMAQRRQIERALLLRGKQLVEQGGGSVSASVEREAQETLSAALAEPDVANEVRSGRLIKPAAYSGFGGPVPAVAPARPAPARPEPVERQPMDLQERAAQRARERRAAAERKLAEARAGLKSAADALEGSKRAVAEAAQAEQDLAQRVEALQEQLRKVQREAADAERARRGAEHGQELAEKAHAAAEKDVERAERELAALD